MSHRCINAARDLSPELFTALKAAVGADGVFVWVPGVRSATRSNREAYVLRLTAEGHTTDSIASELFVTSRTVRRIRARARAIEKQKVGQPGLECAGNEGTHRDQATALPEGGAQ